VPVWLLAKTDDSTIRNVHYSEVRVRDGARVSRVRFSGIVDRSPDDCC